LVWRWIANNEDRRVIFGVFSGEMVIVKKVAQQRESPVNKGGSTVSL
jgi:hypothetical protein